MNKIAKIAIPASVLMPLFAYAADAFTWLTTIEEFLNRIIPVLMVLATIVFLWGVIQYVLAGGDEEKVKSAKTIIITGLVGLFAMLAVWGIVRGIVSTFQVGGGTIPGGPGDITP